MSGSLVPFDTKKDDYLLTWLFTSFYSRHRGSYVARTNLVVSEAMRFMMLCPNPWFHRKKYKRTPLALPASHLAPLKLYRLKSTLRVPSKHQLLPHKGNLQLMH
jgi:hypothetical protein